MKTTATMKMAMGIFAVCLALGAAAADISGVTVRQRWPWSRLVDIDYVLCDATQAVDVAVTAYNGSTPLTLPDGSLSGDRYGVSADGTHRIVWDPTVTSYTNNEVLAKFKVSLTPSVTPSYMIVDLTTGEVSYQYCGTNVWEDVTNEVYKTDKLLLRRILAGTFVMGSPSGEPGRTAANEDLHLVTLTKDYYIGVYEVTQAQWQHLMSTVYSWPSVWSNSADRPTRPVETVSYNDVRGAANGSKWPSSRDVDASSFFGKLQTLTHTNTFDLPTEAQWEYACRAGTTNSYNDGLGNPSNATLNDQMNALGRYLYNGGKIYNTSNSTWVEPDHSCGATNGTAKVGTYARNLWGLYDMHGNVYEWCLDWYGLNDSNADDGHLGTDPVTDPVGSVSGSKHVKRGGEWGVAASNCRSAWRGPDLPTYRSRSVGFRVVSHLP